MKNLSKILFKKITFSKLLIFIIFAGLFNYNLNLKNWKKENYVIKYDVLIYYSYLPATFIFNDITCKFKDTYKGDKKFRIWGTKTKNGGYVQKTTMGPAIMYSPFFFPAHLYAKKYGYNTGGYSEPYRFALIFSSLFYLLAAMIFIRKLLKRYFSEMTTGFVLLALILGTNVIIYTTKHAAMPHNQSLMLISVFLYYTVKWHEKATLKNTVIIGITIGLISLIRPTNAIIIVFFLLYNITKASSIKNKVSFYLDNYKYILLIIILAVLIWIPQLLYWKEVTGNYWYYSYKDENFFFNNPQIINGLFSYRKGMLIYTPVLVFSFIGLPFLYKNNKTIFWGTFIFTILNIYIIFSWWCWWYGGGFGQRAFIDSYVVLALPLAAILEYFLKKRRYINIAFLFFFNMTILTGIYHTHMYQSGYIHYDGMTKKAYFDIFGKLKWSKDYWKYIKRPDYDAAKKGIEEY